MKSNKYKESLCNLFVLNKLKRSGTSCLALTTNQYLIAEYPHTKGANQIGKENLIPPSSDPTSSKMTVKEGVTESFEERNFDILYLLKINFH